MQKSRFNWLFSLALIGLSITLIRYSWNRHFQQLTDSRLAREGSTGSGDPLTKLTDAQAESLSKHKGFLDLRELREITDNQAELLSQHQGPLYLDRLHYLTDAQAESFSKCKYKLSLNGIKLLTAVQAGHLSKHHGGLSLWGIETLSDEQSEIFAHSESVINGETEIDPHKFTVLSDAMVESLVMKSMHKKLRLDNVKRITDGQAELLSRHEGDLILNGLKYLSEIQAELLSDHLGQLQLNGLLELTDAQADSLSRTVGVLTLNGIVKLTDSQAAFLSKQRYFLSLAGLKELSDAQAELLSKDGTTLDVSQQLESKSTSKIAGIASGEFLVESKASDTEVNVNLSRGVANSASEVPSQERKSHKWQIVQVEPSGQKSRDDKRSEILNNQRILVLDGLTALSDTQANYLCSFKGQMLSLSGLKDVSEYAKGRLRSNRHIIAK